MADFKLTQTAQEVQDLLTSISSSTNAAGVSFTPAVNIIATNVQTAVVEVSTKSVKHNLAIAENDVLVGSPTPFGSWIKKTISEFKTILGLGSAAYTASTAYDVSGAAAGILTPTISNGDLTHAPDGNSVFDALALKANTSDVYTHPSSDGNLHVPANSTTNSGKVLTASASAGTYTWEAPIVSSLNRINKIEINSPVTLVASDCSGFNVYTNTGATAEVVMKLPAGADGLRVNSIITAAYDYTFVADGTETIRYLSIFTKAGGSIKSSSIGNELQLDWTGTCWTASVFGTSWQLEID